MFNNSTQKRCWIFQSEEILENMRTEANKKFQMKILPCAKLSPGALLEPQEEEVLRKYYEKRLLEFCSAFKPIMPKSVVGTASMYFKRFFLNNSVMEYHPRTIMLTSVYLACKVDEFNVSSSQFVANLWESPAGQEKALEQILDYLTECLMLKDNNECLSKLVEVIRRIKTLVKKYDPPRPEEVNLLKQKLEHLHSLDLGIITSLKKRKGYEEDGTISKKPKMEEEEWSDDDLADAM
ncbi:hypothetical protein chiPu_0003948 [Chiloscyllium punctatum]|uniref:Cyclin-like domain-containing protein n=1 Tax=Chiloscyllium punctatum TaxID=137246 RepID=A0A401S565_CHIPU|nr:hypothetical protein [Chiloscyllium punctatum]